MSEAELIFTALAELSTRQAAESTQATGLEENKNAAQIGGNIAKHARGQAWAIYGYTVCFRETKDRKYLDQALKTFEFMKNHKNMPADLVPYWDLDAPNIPNEPRDASSASVIASALYEICTYPVENPQSYKEYADKIMESLATADYTAPLGENGRFLLMHSVGSIPHNSEIDVPLNYADYYYLEALKRKIDLEKVKHPADIRTLLCTHFKNSVIQHL